MHTSTPLNRLQNVSTQSTPMSRKRSSCSGHDFSPSANKMTKGSYADTYQINANEPFVGGRFSKMRRTMSGRQGAPRVPEIVDVAIRSPSEWADSVNGFSNEDLGLLPLKTNILTPSLPPHQFPNTSFLSQSPLTPTSDGVSNGSYTFSTPMSRADSYVSGSLCGPLDMMAIDSQRSNPSETGPADGLFSNGLQISPTTAVSSTRNYFDDHRSRLCSQPGRMNDVTYSGSPLPETYSHSTILSSSFEQESRMTRTSSTKSADSAKSRASLRLTDQVHAQNSRPIAPKQSVEETLMLRQASASGHQMTRIKSEDGSMKDVVAIARAPCTTPAVEKLKCDKCNKNPGGFRGPHELQRHKERAHTTVRKAWVCVDVSPKKDFLASCKACRNNKSYGAYYNAAAHLRRTHFNKKQKGRKGKGKTDEKPRAGVSGGDEPSMDVLKLWMKEIDELVPENMTEDDLVLALNDPSSATLQPDLINNYSPSTAAHHSPDCAAEFSSANIFSTQTQPLISHLEDYTTASVVQSHQPFATDATHLLRFPINSEYSDLNSDPSMMFTLDMSSDNPPVYSVFDGLNYFTQ